MGGPVPKRAPFYYSVCGLHLRANGPIPGLVPLPSSPASATQLWVDLLCPWPSEVAAASQEVWYISRSRDELGRPALMAWKLAGGAYFRLLYNDGTDFVVDRQGTRVWANWPEPLTTEDMATYLLGPVLGFVLRLRGATCLHASTIAVGGRAIALTGPRGAGKSTTAAAFATQGYPILGDDIAPLQHRGDAFLVQSTYPCLRLWPDAVRLLYGSPDAVPCLTPSWDKRFIDLTQNGYRFQQEPLQLAAIYVLGESSADPQAPFVEPMPAHVGLITLLVNAYMTYLSDKAMRGRDFELLSRVVSSVTVRRVVTPCGDSTYLSELCECILADFGNVGPVQSSNTSVGA